jgi:hypothetical protein
MKRVQFSVFVMLVLLWNCGMVFAQEKGGGRGRRERYKQIRKGREKSGGQQGDANETRRPAKGTRTGMRKQLRKRTEEREKMREMERKVKEGLDRSKGESVKHQLEMVQKKVAQEQVKHMRRLARLDRIRQLAAEEGRTDIVKRVDELRRKEQQRYGKKQGILKGRESRLARRKEGGRRIPSKLDREQQRKRRERYDRGTGPGKRRSKGKEREGRTADSNAR